MCPSKPVPGRITGLGRNLDREPHEIWLYLLHGSPRSPYAGLSRVDTCIHVCLFVHREYVMFILSGNDGRIQVAFQRYNF